MRRALFLFAIVLGLAALAATLSQPSDKSDEAPLPATAAEPAVAGPPADVRFDVAKPRKRTILAGQAAEVYVEADRPGQAAIAELGVSAAAEPLTPARFDLLVTRPGRYEVSFVPADETPAVGAGTLVVEEAEPEA